MAKTATPYGLKPIGQVGSAPYSGGTVRGYRVTTNNTYAIYTNGWVTMNAGVIDGAGAVAPISTLDNVAPSATQTPLGVVTGVQYTDPTLKYSLWGQYLPEGAITAGYTNVIVYVITDPRQLYMVQVDGSANTTLPRLLIGKNMNLNVPSVVTATGLSSMAGIASTIAATITFPLRIVDVVNAVSLFGGGIPDSVAENAATLTYTDYIVQWNHRTLSCQLQTGV